jgi:hypothetical protein
MAKAQKPKAEKKPKKERAHKYEEKLRINGSFQDLMNELVPPSKKETPKKK